MITQIRINVLVILLVIISGCTPSEPELSSEEQQQIKELEYFKDGLKNYERENVRLNDQINGATQLIKEYDELDPYAYVQMLDYVGKSMLDMKYIIDDVFNHLDWENDSNKPHFLWNFSNIVNENRYNDRLKVFYSEQASDGKKDYHLLGSSLYRHIMWMSLDKSPEYLEYIMHDDYIDYLAELFSENRLYKEQKIDHTVDALLLAYEEIGQNDTLLNQLYSRADTVNVMIDSYYDTDIVSDAVKALVSDQVIKSSFIDEQTRLHWIYSFWVRRHYEGNAAYIYDLIKTFDRKMNERIDNNQMK